MVREASRRLRPKLNVPTMPVIILLPVSMAALD